MDYTNLDETATITTSGRPPCKHHNGWYQIVHFWIFKKWVFLCLDCEQIIDIKRLKADRE